MSDRTRRLSKTGIPYLDAVWNIVSGCGDERISPGCAHCYARTMTGRNLWGYDWTPRFHEERLEDPLHHRQPLRIGVTFMGDLWHEAFTWDQRWQVMEVIENCPQHTFVDLTKRPAVRRQFFAANEDVHAPWPLSNYWAGATICNQPEADLLTPEVLGTPAAMRFVSYEPALAPVDFGPWIERIDHCRECGAENDPHNDDVCPSCLAEGSTITTWGHLQAERVRTGERWEDGGPHAVDEASIGWIILGGETGPGARPMQPSWALDVYRQCKAAKVPFFFKSWGKHVPGILEPHIQAEREQMEQTREWPGVRG